MLHENFARFLQNIAEEKEGFSFGSLIKINEKALGFIIPILRHKKIKRDYRLLEECKNVTIEDTGNIASAKIINNEDTTVFIRSGTIFMGKTQERATVGGIILQPDEQSIITVKCVHASKPISKGAIFHVAEHYAPRPVATMLYSEDQGRIWESIDKFETMIKSGINRLEKPIMLGRKDDLLHIMQSVERSKKHIEGLIQDIPPIDNQVGVVVFGLTGVVGFEVFDSTESWRALHKKVIAKYTDVLTEGPEEAIYELKQGIINKKMNDFIEEILKAKETCNYTTKIGSTYVLTGKKLVGEYSEINGRIIHVLAMEHDSYSIRKPPWEKKIVPLYDHRKL